MSALSSILCFVVIFQIIPQLLCDDTTIIPTDASSKPTTVDIKSSPTNVALAPSTAAAAAAALPSAPPSSTILPSDTTMKPTRATTGGVSAGLPSTQPPLIHNSSPEPLPTNKTIKSLMSAKNITKIEKNSANSIYNHGILASFIVLLVGAIF